MEGVEDVEAGCIHILGKAPTMTCVMLTSTSGLTGGLLSHPMGTQKGNKAPYTGSAVSDPAATKEMKPAAPSDHRNSQTYNEGEGVVRARRGSERNWNYA